MRADAYFGRLRGWVIALCLCTVASCRPAAPVPTLALSAADRDAIRSLDTAFVQAWLRDDTAGVMRLFDSSAILFPPGAQPVAGVPAIRSYWFPADGSHTRITGFTRDPIELDGSGRMAFFRGDAHLAWVYEKAGARTASSSHSMDLVIVAKDTAGRWHIIRQIWATVP
jgi:ketosteroid isomerase-like protein